MGRSTISVGDDTPSGEPETGPKGPYITDKDDGSNSPANETVNDKLPGGVKNKKRLKKPDEKREEQPDEREAPDPLSRGAI